MKTLKSLKKITLAVVLLVAFSSCNNDDDNTTETPMQLNIVETAQTVDDLSILVDAVVQAGLVDALTAAGDKTVLAPTNTAFTAFLEDNGFSSLSEVPNDVLTQVLLNHVITGTNIASADLSGNTGYTNTLADGPNGTKLSLYYDGTAGVMFNGGAEVTLPDVMTTNGVVHVIDQVIALPTIATFATTNPALSTLVDALVYADSGDPTVPYITTVSNADAGPFTVFAPTNDAFVDLLEELEADALTDIATSTVDAVLLHHIVNANVQSSGLATGEVSTLGDPIMADTSTFTLTDGNGRMSNIITTLVDIQGINGVVHVIDKVILPATE
ncbi:fasciclin domain-containing protein [Algibacter sp. AS12]|uniref:fasciclin domain-containing protein n=1 Tax=Algibacter sp. AS12 TaxID=3135773 RepID=UPI00398B3CE0